MNRKIKFRFWNKEDKYYSHSASLSITGEGVVLFAGSQLHGRKYEAEQWTGMTDKNGVEVHEGDILRVKYLRDTDIGEVKFSSEQTSFVWYPKKLTGVFVLYTERQKNNYNVEVIGNIHEHKNLLED